MNDAVRLCRRGQVLAPFARQFKSESQHAIYATPGEHRLLQSHLIFGSLIDAAANIGIFPFVVLSHYCEIDLTGLPILQWTFDTVEKPHWP
jgi:nitric oxide reductase activation protein